MALKDAQKRAKELHSKIKHKHTRDRNTTAVLNTKENIAIVASNEVRLRREQREVLEKNEIEATGLGHAEETAINKTDEMNLTGKEIGVSRNICFDCEILIKKKGLKTKAGFSGKKSKKRQ